MFTNRDRLFEPRTRNVLPYRFGRNYNGNFDGSAQWDRLPDGILVKIFSKLDQKDLMKAARVCQSWQEVINSTALFWRKIHLKLQRSKNKKYCQKAVHHIRKRGIYFRELSVTCCHGNETTGFAQTIDCFCRLVQTLPMQLNLTKLKISDLRLHGVWNNLGLVRKTMIHLLSRQDELECFQMSSARWPIREGKSILRALFTVSKRTLRSLEIDGFFEPDAASQGPDVFDEVFAGIRSLSRLTKLGLDYGLMSDVFLLELPGSQATQLRVLKISTKLVDGSTTIVSRKSWETLTTAIPALKVTFTIEGVYSLIKMVRILNPAIPVKKIRLMLQTGPNEPEVGSVTTAALLGHITMNFRHSLNKFELDIGKKSGFIDLAFIGLVRKCTHLIDVKTPKQFSHPESERVVRALIEQRRRKREMRLTRNLANKRVKQNPVDQAGPSTANATIPEGLSTK
ncbi:F-box only protein 39-like [Physella acuta]|uniref:F-box only protein 39-like n=1 Tax=Physella acuta TaxID=109671 RepID=UPI0027DC62B2|nr:F-box only protein 39-like [Physella acuta]